MQTCVIGGAGFIGGYLVDALLASGRDVTVLGRRQERPGSMNVAARYQTFDFEDKIGFRQHMADCAEIVDLSYASVPKTSFSAPLFDIESNLPPFIALLEEAKHLPRLRKLVVTSSGGTIYGPARKLPITEECETRPISPYGITKLAIERYAMMFHLLASLPVTIVRPANAYGLGQKPFSGQGFVATAIGHILKREPVTIFGETGTIRDYIHVRDIAAGILCAMEHTSAGEIYNLGTGVGHSNLEVLSKLGVLAERDEFPITIDCVEPRGFDVAANVLSHEKLFRHTGWKPKTSLETGLLEMWEGMSALAKSDG
ncbi:NAD-dependent epimerase/dehydratase family protein [Rhizobium sp. 18055]|uniref:NAD-dependent epimerase/dehydratase family protein n=1 Tax=Rhizobium sp. 18055 TaxID=2681403 RepID=UPI0013592528|nr:NAD-dependent epimerase/dehydratase family protein [Rhizobium sp. 18055]